ncbi:MAG: 50S ribosomal protein L32 [Bacteroidia bacterium]|nr:50S ribosomal protein L32 [Bacteroidia bacterium]
MPNPKRRHSACRRDKRRTHDKLSTKPMYIDEMSGEPTLLHRVNLESGFYRGRQVMKGKDE